MASRPTNFDERVAAGHRRLLDLRGFFDADRKIERVGELEHLSGQPEFWNDQLKAQELLKERKTFETELSDLAGIAARLEDADIAIQMFEEAADDDFLSEAVDCVKTAETQLRRMEFSRMMSGRHDKAAAFVAINSGAGGTESQDWTQILLRMYVRFCERQGWKVEITDELAGDEAGIKSVTLRIEGEHAFGYLKAENGVHRLVRISPFDSNKRRHTSFASVAVLPEIDDSITIEINDGDLRVDTYRSSGAGGQHVNKTDSAVRLTHLPTNTVVACQAERSQHKNRSTAMKLLKAKLYALELQKRADERDLLYAGKAKIDFGSQIRSYVLQPYQMVKDLRTGYQTSDTRGFLDGELSEAIEWFLLMHSGERAQGAPIADED
ncbi:MAG: peptide chain release factor 2 [Myxococcales bacterium]|nr:peptide chain release factor 2 [Myxococcales bacterium]